MPPGGGSGGGGGGQGGKRKRNDRTFSQDEGPGRPSPHRPESLNLAQQNQRYDGGRNNNDRRRSTRGGGNNNNNNHNMNGHGHGHGHGQTSTPSRPAQQHTPSRATPTPSRATPAGPSAAVSPAASSPAPPTRPDAPPSEALPTRSQQTTPAPQYAPRQPSPPREAPRPYTYQHLTDTILSNWQEGGKQSIIDAFTPHDQQEADASCIIQELIRSSIDGRMAAQDAGAVLKDVLSKQSDEDRQELQSLVADIVNVLEERDWKTSALRNFISASAVSPDVLREELDVETLQALGLVRNTFSTMRNRKTTNLIYRQANFNLLREEPEGYSKLITEYFNVSHVDNLNGPVAEDAFQRIKALVGSFDLDVGRVLDITLDLMSNLLVKNFRFFVKILCASSWWPEEKIPECIRWSGQDFTSLPSWAEPNSGAWNTSPDERERLAGLREARDLVFWNNLKQHGMKAFFELGARKITNLQDQTVQDLLNTELQPELNARGQDTNFVRRTRINSARSWMRETGCLPPPGNPDAAQILGFKLSFYASDARNKNDEMPENLIWMSALLIKIGFISLRDLYPHLHPADDKLPEVRVKMQQEKEDKERASRPGGSSMNALAKAGALADDTLTAPAIRALREAEKGAKSPKSDAGLDKDVSDPADDLPEPPNQKVMLLKSLLLIGALPEAFFILGRFPWLAELVTDLPEYIHRILHQMLSKVYNSTRPLADRPGMEDPQDHIGDPAGLPKGSLKFNPAKRPKFLRWANLERGDIGDETEYRFYWDDWADNIPVCQTVDDVFQACSTILNYSGVKIGRDPTLLMKLTRIGKHSLAEDSSEANFTRWIDLCKRLLVPALSLTKSNTGTVNEVFELLKLFPIETRYAIYAEWHFGATSRNPDIQSAFKLTQAETKDVLKRLSKENMKTMGKALSKIALSSPGVVMQLAIHQMESYDNLINVVVECVRYFSMLGYDVLVWSLMNALGGGGRNRVQADGMLTSAWLQALSTFAGQTFTRYSAIDPTPVLDYITNELRQGNSTDLEILEQIIQHMVGIRSDVIFNESQVLAMAGGKVLQAQTLLAVADERHKMSKTSRRLMKSLLHSGLAGQLLIAIAQERQMHANHEDTKYAPLKVLGSNVDKISDVFNQYLDALKSSIATKEFNAAVPDIVSLMTDFGLEPGIAFLIGRAGIAAAIAEFDAAKEVEVQQEKARVSAGQQEKQSGSDNNVTTNGDVTMEDADKKPATTATDEAAAGDAEMNDAKEIVQANGVPTMTPTPAPETVEEIEVQRWHPALTPVIEKMQEAMGSTFEASMNIPFYVTFWSLSLEDILVNSASYEQELTTQNYLVNQINNDRSDMSMAAVKNRDAKKRAILDLKERLTQEMRDQIKTYQRVRGRLIQEKAFWFSSLKVKADVLQHSLLQNCFLPRVLLSPLDAHYTFTMIKFLHNNCTPGFRTMYLYDHLLRKNQLAALMYQCTAREAENFGRFLNEVLKDLLSWHAKEEQYEKNAFGVKKNLPGFAKKVNADGSPETFLVYEDFRRLLYKWHSNLNGTFQMCFQSGEYMHIRNAIIVLKAITQHFPVVNFMGNKMVEEITKISKDDPRGDLKLSAMSLIGNLRRLEKAWVLPQAFRIVSVDMIALNRRISDEKQKNNAIPAQKPGSSRSGTPVAGNATPLNPTASEFKPVSGDVAPQSADGTRSEDGEIDEEKKEAEVDDDAPPQTNDETKPEANIAADLPRKPDLRASPPANVNTPTPESSSRQPPSHLSGRTPHALPIKPESRGPPSRTSSERPNDRSRPPRHDGRDRGAPPPEYGRLEPPIDSTRVPNTHSREPSPGRRGRGRSPERDYPPERRDYGPPRPDDRASSRLSQDVRMSDRDAAYGAPPRRDGAHMVHPSRATDGRGYPVTNGSMPPPSQSERGFSRPERGGPPQRVSLPINGPPSAPTSQPSTPGVNPERLALIEGDGPGSRSDRRLRDEPRRDRDERRERGSRPQSPRRADPSPAPIEQKPEPRRAPLDPNPFQSQTEHRDRRDEPRRPEPGDHAPTGPRSGRSAGRTEPPPKRNDLFEQPVGSARRPPIDPSHGRLNAESSPAQDNNYGRLNPSSDPPSGPRSFNGPQQGGRNFAPSGPSADVRGGQPPLSQPPQSPSGRRPLPQQQPPPFPGGRGQYGRSTAPASAPFGPASSPQHTPAAPLGIHPSRLPQLPLDQIQTGPPSGPRGSAPTGPAASTPTSNSPASRMPGPSGPSAGDRKRFANINDTLTGSGAPGPGASIKGRASRQGSGMMPSSPSVPGAPTGPGYGPQGGRPQGPPSQSQAPPVHPSRLEAMGSASGPAMSDRTSSRRDDERSDRHRSGRDDDRSRHGPSDSRDDYRDSERDSRSGRGPRGDRERERDRDGRSDRDRRGGDRSGREPPILASAIQPPPPFNGPPLDQGYPSGPGGNRGGYDARGPPPPPPGRPGDDYSRGGRGPPGGSGGAGSRHDDRTGQQGRDDGRSGGGSGNGRGSERKRRGDEMHDRERNDNKRRRSGM